jgi:phosphatidylglycerophosphate synthase
VVSIVKLSKVRNALKNLEIEYKISLKPRETEEVINQILNRPLAFVTAKFFHRLKKSPNFVTLFSLAFGIASGFLFAKGEYPYVLFAAILLELMIVFDCADGQLARMSGMCSPFGKTLDGLADLATHMSIFYGVAFALYMKTGSFYPFFLGLGAQLSMYLHIILYDHFKNIFIHVSKPGYGDKIESLDTLKGKTINENPGDDSWNLKFFVSKLYYLFYKLEASVVSIGYLPPANNFYDLFPETDRIDSYTREMYYEEMRVSVKLWSFLGDTTHLTFFLIFGVINKIGLIFPVIILFTNLYMLFVLIYQRRKFKKLGLEREILWQERFD